MDLHEVSPRVAPRQITARAGTGFLRAAAVFALVLLAIACASTSAGQPVRPTGTARLAMQSNAPVWGGDAQPAVKDVVRIGVTRQQADAIARACRDAPSELPTAGSGTCEKKIQGMIRLLVLCRSLCLELVRTVAGQLAQPAGFVQIVDLRPGASLCSSGPGRLCFRLGAQAQVLQMLASASPGATPSPNPTPEPTQTVGPAPTTTATPTPTPAGSTSPASPSPIGPMPSPTAGQSP
jgi:hypothetical protein